MRIQEINSHDELTGNFQEGSINYLLLYKKGADVSDCALKSIKKAVNQEPEARLLLADVTRVRDIHGKYNITSAPSLLKFENDKLAFAVKGCHKQSYYKSIFVNGYSYTQNRENSSASKKVIVYTTPTCSWCNTLKAYLRKNNIRFTEIDVSRDEKKARAMVRKSGQQGVPQTEIGGQMIVGFDKARINKLLNIN